MRIITTVDLFAGGGGATTGMEDALARRGLRHRGLAINHCPVAVATMRANHPDVDARIMSVEEAVPGDLVPGREVDLLWASPSCTHHSRAKGGKPRDNQLRSQPDLVLPWLDQLFVRRMIIENVPEFEEWGPLDKRGRPIESGKGDCFRAWVRAIEARRYTVEWRILTCANYGDATTRRRFFLQAVRRGCGRIEWPEPTHAETPEETLFAPPLPRWRGVRECLDLADLGTSIFNRRRPLAAATLRRIATGLERYCGDVMRPFVILLRQHMDCASIDAPLSTITAGGTHFALCQPVVIDHFAGGTARSADYPIGAQTTHDRYSLVTPLVLGQQGGAECRPIDMPCPTIATAGGVRVITPILADGRAIDIYMRMLKPAELAAAHSFPAGYRFAGNRGEQVKQIGNSVPCRTAAAICDAALRGVA